jgi:Galactosyltransferase
MRILIAILGCHARPASRQAQRETWLEDLPGAAPSGMRTEYRYFLGRPFIVGEPDEVFLDVDDSYRKLPFKTRELMRWARDRDYDWVFKCDDDTYVRPELLLSSNFTADPYSGFAGGRWGKVNRPGGPEFVYGYAQGGAGYWVNRHCMGILAEHLLVNEYCEDVAAGKTLALHGIQPVHDARYQPQIGPLELEHAEVRAKFITLHKVNPEQMRRLHTSYRAAGAAPCGRPGQARGPAPTPGEELTCLSA